MDNAREYNKKGLLVCEDATALEAAFCRKKLATARHGAAAVVNPSRSVAAVEEAAETQVDGDARAQSGVDDDEAPVLCPDPLRALKHP